VGPRSRLRTCRVIIHRAIRREPIDLLQVSSEITVCARNNGWVCPPPGASIVRWRPATDYRQLPTGADMSVSLEDGFHPDHLLTVIVGPLCARGTDEPHGTVPDNRAKHCSPGSGNLFDIGSRLDAKFKAPSLDTNTMTGPPKSEMRLKWTPCRWLLGGSARNLTGVSPSRFGKAVSVAWYLEPA
jgi:hypothetical protein